MVAILAMSFLSGCAGSGPAQRAAEACKAEVEQRLAGKTYEFDVERFQASAAVDKDSPDTLMLSAPIVFDRGLASEFTQMLKCKARDSGNSASVLSMEFIWNMEDLKLDK
jgi:hypothetical protein